MQGSQTQSDVHLLLCQKHKHDKSAALIFSLSNSFELTCIFVETVATTSESADKSTVSEVLKCGKINYLEGAKT